MFIEIRPNSPKPIYEQLIWELKRGIVTGELSLGESLPSVRRLAGDIGINMHTVNKVYKQLQLEGVLQKEKSGFVVARELPSRLMTKKKEELQEKIYEILLEKQLYQISLDVWQEIEQAAEKQIKREGRKT